MSYREYRRRRGTCTLVQKEKLAKESRNRLWSGFGFSLLAWIVIAGNVAGVSSTFEWEVFIVVFLVLSVPSFLFFKCLESDAFGSTPVAKALTEVKAVAEPKSEQCSHGIKSPNTDCPECIAFFAAERLAGLERAEIAAKAKKMRFDSLALAQKEFTRLRTEWVQNADSFFKMTWQQFEDEIAVCFSKLGYHVKQTKRTGDGGFDGKITKDGQTLLYECKSGKQNIGRRPIQIFHSAITTEQADGGIYINTGTFLKTAIEYAGRAKVTLIDGTSLVAFLNRAYPARNKALPLSMMCTTCAEVFTVEGLPVTATCSNGHEVKNQITEESLATGNRTYDSERHIWETHYRNPWGWQKIRQTPRVLEPDAVVPNVQNFENLIVSTLNKHGAMTLRNLRRLVHPERHSGGHGPFKQAFDAMRATGAVQKIGSNRQSDVYGLDLKQGSQEPPPIPQTGEISAEDKAKNSSILKQMA